MWPGGHTPTAVLLPGALRSLRSTLDGATAACACAHGGKRECTSNYIFGDCTDLLLTIPALSGWKDMTKTIHRS